jgi:hypothetical protein
MDSVPLSATLRFVLDPVPFPHLISAYLQPGSFWLQFYMPDVNDPGAIVPACSSLPPLPFPPDILEFTHFTPRHFAFLSVLSNR